VVISRKVKSRSVRVENYVGASVGIVMIAAFFLLPFSSSISAVGGFPDNLFDVFRFFITNLGSIPNVQNASLEFIAYGYIFGGILMVLAGLLGTFPLRSGVCGLAGMAVLVGCGFVSPQYTPYPLAYGSGFWALWALVGLQVALSAYGRLAKKKEAGNQAIPTTDPGLSSGGASAQPGAFT
jgi:hypothetical protein